MLRVNAFGVSLSSELWGCDVALVVSVRLYSFGASGRSAEERARLLFRLGERRGAVIEADAVPVAGDTGAQGVNGLRGPAAVEGSRQGGKIDESALRRHRVDRVSGRRRGWV